MKKNTELFVSFFLYPLLVALVLALASLALSKAQTGHWFSYFEQMSLTHWLVVVDIVLIILAAFVVRRIRASMQQANAGSGLEILFNSDVVRREIGERQFKGVLWPIIHREFSPYFAQHDPSPADYESNTPPRCPNCRADLGERKAFWGYYHWICPRGDFHKRTWSSYYSAKDSVQKIIQADFRNSLRNKN